MMRDIPPALGVQIKAVVIYKYYFKTGAAVPLASISISSKNALLILDVEPSNGQHDYKVINDSHCGTHHSLM